ncbi:PEBP family protein [Methanohalobium evestigatum Z-7303]|uniref:PEBP family protein n=1 Tax=Methanohalobium evestigatum (strain ATCC BAA-1072 / DSM 3721 / NBRC 107634 / OCM 161 / Z-7303) TaxID=644295 RepID=D7E733_METEZ|nr:YbhB/YbcL family Raf kinase inhibitor-like protein [Methanohalobium evestigatum]ADI73657.1 PEBP family protein [Methanohalobium evestigatum Z-7303]
MENIEVTSSAFKHNGEIPKKYSCDGEDINPDLQFSNVPSGTESLVLIMDDPDAPVGTFTHWVVWNIDPSSSIKENSVPGVQGANSFGKSSYGGPCPPSGTHRYFFRVYALDTKLDKSEGATKKEVEKAMEGHVVGKGELMGNYSRK